MQWLKGMCVALLTFGVILSPVEGEEIVVRLRTESSLQPIAVLPFEASEAAYGRDYLQQLQQVLQFDLGHNGSTQLLQLTAQMEALGNGPEWAHQVNRWKEFNIAYVVKAVAQGRHLTFAVLAIQDGAKGASLKKFPEIALSGQLAEDRRKIHQIADAMHQALFGRPGIASTRIMYTVRSRASKSDSYQWTADVWVADYDGANAQRVSHDGHLVVTPAFFPPKAGHSAGTFFYVSYCSGQPKIYVASFKGGEPQRLSSLRGNQLMPAISLQRNRVAFICDAAGRPDIFLQDFDPNQGPIGKPRQIFAAERGTQGSPAFSPDGEKIAFVSNKDGAPRIYVMQIPKVGTAPDKIQALLISKRSHENTTPVWSPDGKKLAYTALTAGVRQIWIYEFDTGMEYQLTQGSGHKENPSWAPDSLHLVFNSASESSAELYLISLNQPNATKITSGAGEKRFPTWEPLGL